MDNTVVTANPLASLSFTGERADGGITLWSPEVEGDWGKLCAKGRAFADEACDHIRATRNVPLLPAIARSIAERGSFGGVEVGFFTALSERLMD